MNLAGNGDQFCNLSLIHVDGRTVSAILKELARNHFAKILLNVESQCCSPYEG